MALLVPAFGVPSEELLQDSLKSALVAIFTLAAAFSYFADLRRKPQATHLHALMCLPAVLAAYALGSMVWSHTYLAGVEAIRWFLFSILLFAGSNVLTLDRVLRLSWGIHLGACVAAIWAALQFWFGFDFFPQGPGPASTFVNRNMFAEYLVCTLPFSVYVLSSLKGKWTLWPMAMALGLNIVALLMTGTRSALVGLLILLLLTALAIGVAWRRGALNAGGGRNLIKTCAVVLATVLAAGAMPSSNPAMLGESATTATSITPFKRAFSRTLSIAKADEYRSGSFSVRLKLWTTTARMMLANPLIGVGAGAWEVIAPLYQEPGSQIEIDFYAHNEFLQLLAEYGLAGWLFVVGLLVYLTDAAYRTFATKFDNQISEAPVRAVALASLGVLLLVSCAGFPWRMASTGALFALNLGILVASDLRLSLGQPTVFRSIRWQAWQRQIAKGLLIGAGALAIGITSLAIQCESKLIRGVKLALAIDRSNNPNDVAWTSDKAQVLALLKDGIKINPHYRKLTPIAADAFARWGDWNNAIWIWDSVLQSRPNVVAMLANVARGHIKSGNYSKAQTYLDRADRIQPQAPTLLALQVMIWSGNGHENEAIARANELLSAGRFDFELLQAAYGLGMRHHAPELAIQAMQIQAKNYPRQRVMAWLRLGNLYDTGNLSNKILAEQAFSEALKAVPDSDKADLMARIPADYQQKIR